MHRGVTVYTSLKWGTDFLPFGKRVSPQDNSALRRTNRPRFCKTDCTDKASIFKCTKTH